MQKGPNFMHCPRNPAPLNGKYRHRGLASLEIGIIGIDGDAALDADTRHHNTVRNDIGRRSR
jgi:hypothetical protein